MRGLFDNGRTFLFILLLVLNPLSVASAQQEESQAEQGDAQPYSQFYKNPIAIYGQEVRYDVFRNEKRIGEHVVSFDTAKDTLLVTSLSKLVVRYLGVPVYRYTYQANEVWVDGKLATIESEIRDNRKAARVIEVELRDRVMRVSDKGKSRLAPLVEFATTHWHPAALTVSRMFHTTHGRVRNIKIEDLGDERIALTSVQADGIVSMRNAETRRYRITGGFKAELWYDKHDRWVRLQFNADDGSLIDYKCTTCDPL